jgi:hypothetical protein
MQFTIGVTVLEYSFVKHSHIVKHSHSLLGVNRFA